MQQKDDRGTIAWDVPNSWRLLNLATLDAQFQQVLQTQDGSKLTVNCGGRYRAIKPGDRFECRLTRHAVPANALSKRDVKTGATKIDASETIVIQVQPEGNVTWQEVRVIATTPCYHGSTSSHSRCRPKTDSSGISPNDRCQG